MKFYRYLCFFGVLVFSTFLFSSCDRGNKTPQKLVKAPSPTVEITPTTIISKFTCPESPWVDCMPGPDKPFKPECQKDFLDAAKTNCPGFEGAAL
jgi:hypothetical protein